MKLDIADRIVATSHDFPTVNCTIDAEDMRYISSLLRNNYSNTILATIRETYANAVDANKEVGSSPKLIEVKCPTSLDQTFSVRDFGTGLSRDQIFNLYSKFGKSTKRGSDASIGGFGIGRFAPLSYKDSFTVTSYYNGTKTIYSIYISEENDTKIDQVFSDSTTEANGICISVGVAKNDLNKFNHEISMFFSNFEVLPKFLNLQNDIVKPEILTSGNGWQIRKSAQGYNAWSVGEHGIIMGGIYYSINAELIDFDDKDKDYSWTKSLSKLVFIADIGSVSLHHSRESLEYNKITKTYLKSRYKDFCKEFTDSIKDKVAQFDCLRDVMAYYADIKNTFPRIAFDSLESQNIFVYKGHKVISNTFNKGHYDKDGQNVRIPVYSKLYTLSNDRVSISKCYTLANNKDTYIVFHDMPDNTKVIPRVYELTKKYQNVIVIAHDPAIISSSIVNGVDKFKEINRFDLVKSGFCNLSELTPVKLPSSNKTSPNAASYTPSYFYKVDGCRFRSSSSSDKNINDTSVLKIYFPVSDNKPIGKYAHLYQDKNRLNSYIFNQLESGFIIPIYGVSNNVASKVKFKNRTDFVDFCDYVQKKWNDLSDDVKSSIFEYMSCQSEEVFNIMTCGYILQEVDLFQDFNKKLNDCVAKLKNANELLFAEYLCKWRNTLAGLGVNISHDNETSLTIHGKYINEKSDEIYNKYPMLQLLSELYINDRKKHEGKFKQYISFMNQQNSVDFSKI